MSASTTTFDVNRATDILNKAAEFKMYEAGPDGKAVLPESDADKIVEAEKMVGMAVQAKEIAEQAGTERVPHYDAVMQILFIADVTGGSLTTGHAAAEPEPAPEPVVEQAAAGGPPLGEEWIDGNGTPWVITGFVDQAGNIEVSPAGSDEITAIPLAHLKTRTKEAPPSQPQSPSPSLQPSAASEGSPSPPPPSTETSPPSAPATSSSTPAEQQPPPSPADSSQPSSSSDPQIPVDDDEGDPQYANLLERSEQIYVRAGLPLPGIVEDPPHMPPDLTGVPDEQRRKLHSQFNACAARAHFMLGIERLRKVDCQRLLNAVMKQPMREAREELGKDATVTEIKAKAEENEEVMKWKNRTERHADHEDAYKTLFDIYTENVSVLSRDHTMAGKDEAGS
jgi:hypothetical protein